jgi:cytochrome c
MFKSRNVAVAGLAWLLLTWGALAVAADQRYGLGRAPTPAELAAWNDDVRGDGRGLPSGQGSVAQGSVIYDGKCASCHGDFGEGNGRMPVLAGGRGSLTADRPIPTVGSYWPYAPTLFDYIRRAMPFSEPESLSNDEVYAVTAYVLNMNDIVPKNAVLDARSLSAIVMPNRNGFVPDPRPDVHNVACMSRCKAGPVKVTSDLAKALGVTPGASPAPVALVANSTDAAKGPVTFAQIQPIIAQRCATCHSRRPTLGGFPSAPRGIMLDTPGQIVTYAARIKQQAVTTHTMPVGNMTQMTEAERALLGRWIDAGARL